MATKPVPKYPVDKCINILAIRDVLEEKYKMDLTNLRPGVETENKYHDFNFYDFLGKKLNDNVIYPKLVRNQVKM